MSIKSGKPIKKGERMPRINLEEIEGGKKAKKEGPTPIYLNFALGRSPEEDEIYKRLDKVRARYGTAKIKALVSTLVKSADF